jgi:hypothetical protein
MSAPFKEKVATMRRKVLSLTALCLILSQGVGCSWSHAVTACEPRDIKALKVFARDSASGRLLTNVTIAATDLDTSASESLSVAADTSIYPAFFGSAAGDYFLQIGVSSVIRWEDTVTVPAEDLNPSKCGTAPVTQTITAAL